MKLDRNGLLAMSAVGLAAAPASFVAAQTMFAPAAADNTLYFSPTGAISNGAGEYMFAGKTNLGELRRALVRFDLSGFPAGFAVESVTVHLNMSKTRPLTGQKDVSLHRAAASWGEGASRAFGEQGSGAPAQPGDATWLHRFWDPATPVFWITKGGDFDATPSATTAVAEEAPYAWTSDALAADVRGWLADPDSNFGWAVIGDEVAQPSAKRFDTHESLTPEFRPRLEIRLKALCPANCNADLDPVTGRPILDIRDFACFQNAFALGDLKADVGGVVGCTSDGQLSITDFTCFQNLFALGCP